MSTGERRPSLPWLILGCFDGLNHDVLAHRSPIHELDAAADLGEERVIFPAANIKPGLYASAALTHDDGAAGDELSAECLKSEPLRVRVAAIS